MNTQEVLQSVLPYLPPGWNVAASPVVKHLYSVMSGEDSEGSRVRRFHLLYEDHQRLVRSMDFPDLLNALEASLSQYVAEFAKRRVFIHAGAVGWKGRGILIPGRSLSGKSTLVKELVRAGATYYSDEYAVIDSVGRLHSYPRPLGIREQSGRQRRCTVEELGGVAGTEPLPVGLVVVSHYKREAHWRPRRLTQGQGALALLAHTVSARRQPVRALATLQRIVSCAPVLKGARGEAGEVCNSILENFDRFTVN